MQAERKLCFKKITYGQHSKVTNSKKSPAELRPILWHMLNKVHMGKDTKLEIKLVLWWVEKRNTKSLSKLTPVVYCLPRVVTILHPSPISIKWIFLEYHGGRGHISSALHLSRKGKSRKCSFNVGARSFIRGVNHQCLLNY